MFSPHQGTVDSVYTWLSDFGLDLGRVKHSNNKGWISLDLTTKEAEGLLLTEYHLFESDDGQITPACDRYEP
jgi:tripeptidyl-peptidase-1